MAKREREVEEFDDISTVLHPSPNAKIHAVISLVSPMKQSKSCSCFDGEITDGKACMGVFGFDASVCKKLVEFKASKSALALANCKVKNSRKGEELEVLLSKHTDTLKLKKVFDISEGVSIKVGKEIVFINVTVAYLHHVYYICICSHHKLVIIM